MKLVYICSLINSSFASDYTGDQTLNLNQSREELNEIVHNESQKFLIDQFKPFEETGFTKEMILGGKDIYFAPDFAEKMKCTLH